MLIGSDHPAEIHPPFRHRMDVNSPHEFSVWNTADIIDSGQLVVAPPSLRLIMDEIFLLIKK